MAELSLAYENDLPMPVIQHALWGYLSARYGADGASMKAFETIAKADKALFGTSFVQAQYQLSQGLVEKWQMVLHQQAIGIYDSLFDEDKITGDPIKDAVAMEAAAKAATPKEAEGAMMSIVKAIGQPPKLPAVA